MAQPDRVARGLAGTAAAVAAPAATAGADLGRLVNAFRKHSDQERKVSAQKGLELYEDRTGISYLLPPQRTSTTSTRTWSPG